MSDQAAAIPVRRRAGKTEICVISTSSGSRWTVPKGIIEKGDSARDTALKEAREEAGLTGELAAEPVGHYLHPKWGRTLRVVVYVMQVTGEDEEWEERHLRDKRWVEPGAAVELIGSHPMCDVFRSAVERLGHE